MLKCSQQGIVYWLCVVYWPFQKDLYIWVIICSSAQWNKACYKILWLEDLNQHIWCTDWPQQAIKYDFLTTQIQAILAKQTNTSQVPDMIFWGSLFSKTAGVISYKFYAKQSTRHPSIQLQHYSYANMSLSCTTDLVSLYSILHVNNINHHHLHHLTVYYLLARSTW